MITGNALAALLLQVAVILVASRLTARAVRIAGQPAVVGEMLAGLLLGPSLFGWLMPGAYDALFTRPGTINLQLLSQVGVILFMLVVGAEFDVARLRHRARTTLLVSYAGMIVPLLLGVALSLAIVDFAPQGVHVLPFALFVGIAMSITAFPVLARILSDRCLTATRLGTTAMACAAVDDVTAWWILSVVVAVATSSALGGALLTVTLSIAFAVLMLLVVRPLVGRLPESRTSSADGVLVAAIVGALLSAVVTDAIGVHPVFGAFLAGVAVSGNPRVRGCLEARLRGLATAVLVPLFFAAAGLRTELTLLQTPRSWLVCGLIVVVAVAGKLGGCAAASRWSGMTWRDALSLGALMNTRGLMQLVVLTVGYDLGLLSPALFSMMTLMALVTTAMTSPLLTLFAAPVARQVPDVEFAPAGAAPFALIPNGPRER